MASQKIMETIGEASPVLMNPKAYDYSQADTIVNVLYKFQDSTWNELIEKIPSITDLAQQTMDKVTHLNSFLGNNIGEQPLTQLTTALHNGSIVGMILAVLIPVLAGLTQFISVKLQPNAASADKDNPMASSMKTMTYTMPLISVVMGFTLPAGLGLYWAASAAVRCIQQLAINKYLSTKSLDEMIKENQKKAQKKRERSTELLQKRSIRWQQQVLVMWVLLQKENLEFLKQREKKRSRKHSRRLRIPSREALLLRQIW